MTSCIASGKREVTIHWFTRVYIHRRTGRFRWLRDFGQVGESGRIE